MNQIIQDNIHLLGDICKAHHVSNMFVFGSVCTDKFNEQSDIDILVSFEKLEYADYADNYFELVEKLESLFQRAVDLVTVNSLSNPYFIESVNQNKTLVYAA